MNRTAGRIAWMLTGSVLTVALVALGAINVLGALAHEVHTEVSHFAADDIAEVRIRSDNGRITVQAAEVDRVTVSARISRSLGTTRHREHLVGDVLELTSGCPVMSTWCSVDWTVTVPSRVALDVKTSNGRIEVAGLDGPVTAHSSNGRLSLDDLGGPLELTSHNGSIDATNLRSPDVEATTHNGHVELSFVEPAGQVRVSNHNGWVEVHVPDTPGAYRVDASTHNGSRRIGVRTDPTSADSISITSHNGHVAVDYVTS